MLSQELYQQMLAKALAHYFEAKLLLLDVTDFSLKVRRTKQLCNTLHFRLFPILIVSIWYDIADSE